MLVKMLEQLILGLIICDLISLKIEVIFLDAQSYALQYRYT